MERNEIKILLDKVRFFDPSMLEYLLRKELEVSKEVDKGKYPNLEPFKKYMARNKTNYYSTNKLYGTIEDNFVFSDGFTLFALNTPLVVTPLLKEYALRRNIIIDENPNDLSKLLIELRKEREYFKTIIERTKDGKIYFNGNSFRKESYDDLTTFLGKGSNIEISNDGVYVRALSDAGEGYLIGRRLIK